MTPLTWADLDQHAVLVAPALLGSRLTTCFAGNRVTVRITEVEAYGGVAEDPGSHAFRGETARNAAMFGPSGNLYVYFTYGMHWCANVVTGPAGQASAVLLRAGEVIEGRDVARERRPSARADRDLARGPARLAMALGITGDANGLRLGPGPSQVRLILPVPTPPTGVGVSRRTGVSGPGAVTPWRFYLEGDPFVSPYRNSAR